MVVVMKFWLSKSAVEIAADLGFTNRSKVERELQKIYKKLKWLIESVDDDTKLTEIFRPEEKNVRKKGSRPLHTKQDKASPTREDEDKGTADDVTK